MIVAHTLTESGGVTHLDARMEAEPQGIMRVFAPLMAKDDTSAVRR
jgi:hypothetical protein